MNVYTNVNFELIYFLSFMYICKFYEVNIIFNLTIFEIK